MKPIRAVGKIAKDSVSYDQVKGDAGLIMRMARLVFGANWKPNPDAKSKTFKEAGIDMEQAKKNRKMFRFIFSFYLVLGLFFLAYLAYAIGHADYKLVLINSAVMFLSLAQMFKYSFWLFQIKQQKLGCTWREWLAHITGSSTKEGN